ncbi:hypothetical protein SLA2020_045190 [Shorea laevis]
MGLRADLHPKLRSSNNSKLLPKACYQMTAKEKDAFFKNFYWWQFEDLYLKELLQLLLSCVTSSNACVQKVLKESDLSELKSQSAMILCEMEKIFPPSFFTVMVHLIMHLAEEVKLGGPVAYRWMYPIERFLLTLKNYFEIERHHSLIFHEWFCDRLQEWNNKVELFAYRGFDPLLTVDEMYEKINDPQVDKEQFEVLVKYWRSEKGKESPTEGRKPSRAELYIQSRTKKEGGPVSEKASQVMLVNARFPDENITNILQAAN